MDSILGRAGNDSLYGGASAEILGGGTGNDDLVGGLGQDTLYGGAGDDTLTGYVLSADGTDTDAADRLIGGIGDDNIALGSNDFARGGDGADTFTLGTWITGGENAVIGGFSADEDSIEIGYDASGTAPVVTIEDDGEGNTAIMADGAIVGIVAGLNAASTSAGSLVTLSPMTF
jgi:Ca2+-binding RTX toxin-like protein